MFSVDGGGFSVAFKSFLHILCGLWSGPLFVMCIPPYLYSLWHSEGAFSRLTGEGTGESKAAELY